MIFSPHCLQSPVKKKKERNHNTDNSELWVKYLSWISAKERARKKQLENRLLRRKQSHLKLSGSPAVSSWISAKKQRGRNSETKIERERNQEHRCNKTVRHIWSSLLNISSWILVESRSWRDRNLIFYFFPNYPPPDHNLGQILNSDLASSYFPFNTPTERSSKKNLVESNAAVWI